MIDYSAEPPRYPDGHVCNYYCRGGEHCDLAYYDFDPGNVAWSCLLKCLRRLAPSQTPTRLERAPEAPRSCDLPEAGWMGRDYTGAPRSEVAYRYWFTYPAHVEAAVCGEVST